MHKDTVVLAFVVVALPAMFVLMFAGYYDIASAVAMLIIFVSIFDES